MFSILRIKTPSVLAAESRIPPKARARVAHAVIYVAGIPYIRAIAFGVSLGGLFAIAGELLSAWSVAG